MTGGLPVPTIACSGSSSNPGAPAPRWSCLASSLTWSATLFTELRVHVPDRGEIRRPRPRVELAEQRVIPRFSLQLGDTARRIVQIAEHDRVGRARLLTRGLDFAVLDAAILFLGLDLHGVDALYAVGALLHHAAAAHRDVRISSELQARRVPVLIEEIVEAANFVWTVVRAVARADTAVVHHVVQPFVTMDRRAHGTHRLARRVLAVHARHRLEVRLGMLGFAAVVRVDADPVHLTAAQHFGFSYHRNVVLRLAADDARVAADAGIDIDRHAPLVAFVLEVGVQRDRLRRRFVAFVNRLRVVHVLVSRDRAHHAAAFHQVVILRAREGILLAGVDDLDAGPVPQRVGRANRVGVEARAGARMASPHAAVTEMHGDAVVRVTDDREHCAANRAPLIPKLDDVADDLSVLAAGPGGFVLGFDFLGGRWAHDDRVVPRQLRDRFRQLLQPAVVREPPVKDARVVAKRNFEAG